MKKNVTRRLLTLVLACIVILGCMQVGALAEAEEKVTLTILQFNSLDRNKAMAQIILDTYPEFADRVNIDVIDSGPEGDKGCADRFRLALASGEPIADIIILNYKQVPEFAKAGALMELDDMYEGYWDNVVDAAKELATYEGKKIAVANQVNSKMFFYRKDIFDQCGLDPHDWKTVDDFIAGAKVIQEKMGPDYYIHNISKSLGVQEYASYLMFTAFDSKMVDESGNYIVNQDPGLRQAFETMKKLLDSGICLDGGDFSTEWESALASGHMVGHLTASWFKSFIPGYAPDDAGKWTACMWPDEIAKGSEAGGSVFVIPTFAQHPEEAKEFLKYCRLEDLGASAVLTDTFVSRTPITKSLFESDLMKGVDPYLSAGDPYWQIEYESYNNGKYAIFPYTPQATVEMNLINSWGTRYYTGELTLDEMLDGLQSDLEIMVGNPFE